MIHIASSRVCQNADNEKPSNNDQRNGLPLPESVLAYSPYAEAMTNVVSAG